MKTITANEKEITAFFPGHMVSVETSEHGSVTRVQFVNPANDKLIFEAEYGMRAKRNAPVEYEDKWMLTVKRTDGFSKTEEFKSETAAQKAQAEIDTDPQVESSSLEKVSTPKE